MTKKRKIWIIAGVAGALTLAATVGIIFGVVLRKKIHENASPVFKPADWTAFRNSKSVVPNGTDGQETTLPTTQFPDYTSQYQHEKKQPLNDNWHGPVFTGYWGWDNYDQPFDAADILRQSNFTNFTFGFLNELGNDGDTADMKRVNTTSGAGYLDQIQEIKALGGSVTFSFGGATPHEGSFYNYAPSTYIMYEKLLALVLGYKVYSLDFDFEYPHNITDGEIRHLAAALQLLRTQVKNLTGKNMQYRFTQSYFEGSEMDILNQYIGTDFIYNDMSLTSISSNNDSSAISHAIQDLAAFRNVNAYSKMSDLQIYEHLGITAKVENDSYNKPDEFAAWAIENRLGLIGLWTVTHDHKENSPNDLNPGHETTGKDSDFYYVNKFTNGFQNHIEQAKPTAKPDDVAGLYCYSHNKSNTVLKWNPVKGATTYVIKEGEKVITTVNRTTAGINYLDGTGGVAIGNHVYSVYAQNSLGLSSKPIDIKVNITKDDLSTNVEYYDKNIPYHNNNWVDDSKYVPTIPYIYYKGNFYQNINSGKADGIKRNGPSPDKDSANWKVMEDPNNSNFGLSKQRINDLKNFTYDNYVKDTDGIQTIAYEKDKNTLINHPDNNKFINQLNGLGFKTNPAIILNKNFL